MWDALFKMCQLFNKIALKVSGHYGYSYNRTEYTNVFDYLHAVKNMRQDKK